MKKLSTISVLLFAATCLFAQVPEKMSYQAVVRDASGILVSDKEVGMQISILQWSAMGIPAYVELQSPETNSNGLVSVEIGGGIPLTGTFSGIDWSDGPFFIKTEVDPAGGANYTISGTTQVLSVPFALHAKTAESVDFSEVDPIFEGAAASTITLTDIDKWNTKVSDEIDPVFTMSASSRITEDNISAWDNKLDMEEDGSDTNEIQTISKSGATVTLSHAGGSFTDSVNTYMAGPGIEINDQTISLEQKPKVGDLYKGGIIFFVDHTGEHGLIASLDDLDGGDGVVWSDNLDSDVGSKAQSATDGVSNTNAMLVHQFATSAAQLCRDLGSEWYLPSNRELYMLFSQELIIDQILDNDGDPNTNGLVQEKRMPTRGKYWSSTEHDTERAWAYKAPSGDTSEISKSSTFKVRAVQAF